jgi:hypothetical protein
MHLFADTNCACYAQQMLTLTEFSVDFRLRSNMKNVATASLHTSGSMLRNSLWPPRSQMLNVISVLRSVIVFSMKFTPAHGAVHVSSSR